MNIKFLDIFTKINEIYNYIKIGKKMQKSDAQKSILSRFYFSDI